MTPEGGYVGPEQMFSALFGGEKFVPIIGSVSLAKKMKAAMQEAEGEEDDDEEDSVAAGASGKMNVSRQEGGGGGLGGIRNAIQRCCRLGKRLRGMEQRGRSPACHLLPPSSVVHPLCPALPGPLVHPI